MRRWAAGAVALCAGVLAAGGAHFLISIAFGAIAGLLFVAGVIPDGETFRLVVFSVGGTSLVAGIAVGGWVTWKAFGPVLKRLPGSS